MWGNRLREHYSVGAWPWRLGPRALVPHWVGSESPNKAENLKTEPQYTLFLRTSVLALGTTSLPWWPLFLDLVLLSEWQMFTPARRLGPRVELPHLSTHPPYLRISNSFSEGMTPESYVFLMLSWSSASYQSAGPWMLSSQGSSDICLSPCTGDFVHLCGMLLSSTQIMTENPNWKKNRKSHRKIQFRNRIL